MDKRVWGIEELVDYCLSFKPQRAAESNDSSLCVSPLIEYISVDGQEYPLELKDGKWGAHNVRVSSERQRSGKARASRKTAAGVMKEEGYSEQEQLLRGIRYFVSEKQAFKIYSDAGVTGEYPSNNSRLITRLLAKKAARYKKIFENTLLDENSLKRRSDDEIEALRNYLNKHLKAIYAQALTEEDIYTLMNTDKDEKQKREVRGRPKTKVLYRQGFSQLWHDIEADCVSVVTVTDRSRLCRDADLESEFLILIDGHKTRLKGLIDDLSHLDVSDPLRRGMTYMIATIYEYQLEYTAGNSFRGIVQLLETGRPGGLLPWWLKRNEFGYAEIVPGSDEIIRRIVDLYLSGLGVIAITTTLRKDEIKFCDKYITQRQILSILADERISGIQYRFGLPWNVLPCVISAEVVSELKKIKEAKVSAFDITRQSNGWANHLFTGLLRCSCGQRMEYKVACGIRRQQPNYCYYRCHVDSKKLFTASEHSSVNAVLLEKFIRDLFRDNPNIINGAFADSLGGDKSPQRAARYSLLEERLQIALTKFKEHEV